VALEKLVFLTFRDYPHVLVGQSVVVRLHSYLSLLDYVIWTQALEPGLQVTRHFGNEISIKIKKSIIRWAEVSPLGSQVFNTLPYQSLVAQKESEVPGTRLARA